MSVIFESIGVAVVVVGLVAGIKEFMDKKTKEPVIVLEPELTKKEKHEKLHDLIARHKEMCERLNYNHELIQSLKVTPNMGKQKSYVWDEIVADKKVRNALTEEIKLMKVEIFGDRATNI